MLTKIAFCVVLLCAALAVGVNCREYMKEKPAFVKTCSTESPEFDDCYRDNLQSLLVKYKDGIPGLPSAGSFDPVKVKRMKMEQNQLKVEMKNVSIYGLSSTDITKITLNRKDYGFTLMAKLPKMQLNATYNIDGKILFLPLNGHGNMWAELKNVGFTLKVKLKLNEEPDVGLTFSDIQSVKTTATDIGGFRINLENLFNGNKELEASTNAVFNDNWSDFIEVLRPTLEEAIDAIVLNRFKKIFNFIPAEYFISNLPKARTLETKTLI